MVIFRFTLGDLARTRFAISPIWELTASLRALRHPAFAPTHLPWLRGLDGRLDDLDMRMLLALVPRSGPIPDFITPPPTSPLAAFDEELEVVRATSPETIRTDLRHAFGARVPAPLRPLVDDPGPALDALADAMRAYWERALEPHWPRIRRLLDADVAHRAQRLTEGGPAALFADLHPSVAWRDDAVQVVGHCEGRLDLDGRGLLLVPSALHPIEPASIVNPPWQPTLIYPARGVGLLWEPGERTPEALAAIVGRSRAALLTALDAPRSTTDLAGALGLSPGGASQHLTALRAAGLVVGHRDGRTVLYVRTPTADALLDGVTV
jgi:hypothetical protein